MSTLSPEILSIKEQVDILARGTVEIIPENGLEEKLKKAIHEKRPLIVKLGADPSAPDIHLGHTVVLRKLRDFQKLGHQIIFLIGDFTGMIGDPSGKSKTRPTLTEEQVKKNAQSYREQIFKILDPAKTEIRFNSEWCFPLTFKDVLGLTSKITVAQLLMRDDFSKRYTSGSPISLIEFMYCLVQGYDSVVLKADIELGGTDQKFNLLVGRDLQKEYGQDPQVCVVMPILEGTDGVKKMSKSLNNYIGISDPPNDMFGKVMSIPDNLLKSYFELLTDFSIDQINDFISSIAQGTNPRDVKVALAMHIVASYYDEDAAKGAFRQFEEIFKNKGLPDEIEEHRLSAPYLLIDLMVDINFAPSKSEAKRLIRSGGVKLDDTKIEDEQYMVSPENPVILKVGKRKFLKIIKA